MSIRLPAFAIDYTCVSCHVKYPSTLLSEEMNFLHLNPPGISLRRAELTPELSSLGPGLIRILPTTCITFLTYENCRFYLPPLLERG